MPSKPCPPGCTCGRHKKRESRPCLPGCTCYRHYPREFQPCGTYAAYQQHKLRGEDACEPCLQANRDYNNAKQREYQQQPEPRRRRLESYRKYRTGLTPEAFAELIESQDGRCAICGSPDPGGHGNWHADHDHACCPGVRSCGKCLRGALCAGCNMALGLFHDDLGRLRSAIAYLESYAGGRVPDSPGSPGLPISPDSPGWPGSPP
jgi:recombination endonuclease VII